MWQKLVNHWNRVSICNIIDLKNRVKIIINIDHHVDCELFGDYNYVEPQASSVAEELYDLDRYLFTAHQTNKNVPISRVRAWQMIREWCNQVGVSGRLGTHTLRKSAGYHMRMAGVPIEMIAEVLGHRSTTITKRYIGITNDEVTKVLKNFNL